MSQKIKSLDQDNVKFLCGLIRNVATIDSAISDLEIASDKVFSSKKVTELARETKHSLEQYIQSSINGLTHLKKKIVDTLPSDADAEENILYLVKDTSVVDDVVYNQYLLIDGVLEPLGNTSTDMSNYYNKDESDAKFALLSNLQTLIDMVGNASDLETTAKDTLVSAINEIKEGLDNCITKDNIVTTLDDTVTDEQVPSALSVYSELLGLDNKFKIEEYSTGEYDLNTFLETGLYYFGSGCTLTNVPNNAVNGYLLVLKSTVSKATKQIWFRHGSEAYTHKDTFMRTFFNNNTVMAKWSKFMIDGTSMLSIRDVSLLDYIDSLNNNTINMIHNVNETVTDTPYSEGLLNNTKVGFVFPYQSSANYGGIIYIPSGSSEIFINHKTAKTWQGWRRICTTSVRDVSKTTLTYLDTQTYFESSNVNNSSTNYYMVVNGYCYVSIYVKCLQVSTSSGIKTLSLPIPKDYYFNIVPSWDISNNSKIRVTVNTNGEVLLQGGEVGQSYITTFSYPVAE